MSEPQGLLSLGWASPISSAASRSMRRSASIAKRRRVRVSAFFEPARAPSQFSRRRNSPRAPILPSKASPKIFAVSPWPGIAVHYVDAVIKRAGRASSVVRKPAQDASWGGYSGYFSDIDGHLWEVAYNPHFPLSDDGRLQLPD